MDVRHLMKNYKETWDIIQDDGLILKCQCKLCDCEFTASYHDHENIKLHWHPKSNQECYMPQCPNGCSQTMPNNQIHPDPQGLRAGDAGRYIS